MKPYNEIQCKFDIQLNKYVSLCDTIVLSNASVKERALRLVALCDAMLNLCVYAPPAILFEIRQIYNSRLKTLQGSYHKKVPKDRSPSEQLTPQMEAVAKDEYFRFEQEYYVLLSDSHTSHKKAHEKRLERNTSRSSRKRGDRARFSAKYLWATERPARCLFGSLRAVTLAHESSRTQMAHKQLRDAFVDDTRR